MSTLREKMKALKRYDLEYVGVDRDDRVMAECKRGDWMRTSDVLELADEADHEICMLRGEIENLHCDRRGEKVG